MKEVVGIYCVYDKLAGEAASPLFAAVNSAVAYRSFKQMLEKNPSYPCPDDYVLKYIGSFQTTSCIFTPASYVEDVTDDVLFKKEEE